MRKVEYIQLSPWEAKILRLVVDNGGEPMSSATLREALEIDSTMANSFLWRMERDGLLVHRGDEEQDIRESARGVKRRPRRSPLYSATLMGECALQAHEAALETWNEFIRSAKARKLDIAWAAKFSAEPSYGKAS